MVGSSPFVQEEKIIKAKKKLCKKLETKKSLVNLQSQNGF
jgi:hypothetical protein